VPRHDGIITASFTVVLPVATPPNIVLRSDYLKQKQRQTMRAGVVLDLLHDGATRGVRPLFRFVQPTVLW